MSGEKLGSRVPGTEIYWMPPPDRRSGDLGAVELLLCGHHFRVSQASLRAAGADVYDKAGLLIMAGTSTAGAPRPGAGRLVGAERLARRSG